MMEPLSAGHFRRRHEGMDPCEIDNNSSSSMGDFLLKMEHSIPEALVSWLNER